MSGDVTQDHRQRKALAVIAAKQPQGLRAAVAQEALDADYEIKLWFSDLSNSSQNWSNLLLSGRPFQWDFACETLLNERAPNRTNLTL